MRFATQAPDALASDHDSDAVEDATSTFSLRSILSSAHYCGDREIEFRSVAVSAETASPGELVVYRVGQDCPTEVAAKAMARGAAGILSEQLLPCALPQCIVGDVDLALAEIAATQHRRPDRRLLTVGVIGSAGKTTTALLVATLFRGAGIRTAYQTDLGSSDGVVQGTPDSPLPGCAPLVEWLADACDAGCKTAIVELSDDLARFGHYDSVEFDLLIVTGSATTTSDYGESGLQCVLDRLRPAGVVIAPADDPAAIRAVRDAGVRMVSYGSEHAADVAAKILDHSGGMTTLLLTHQNVSAVMESSLCGPGMASNHAAAATAGLLIAQPLHEIAEALGSLRTVPGRGQSLIEFGQAEVVLDAAGSPERVATALKTYRSMLSGGRLWCVLAMSADEAPAQLARYGALLERFSHHTVITASDRARPKFLALSHAVLDGVDRCAAMRLVANQERAVRWAVSEAAAGDTILVLGGAHGETAFDQRSALERIEKVIVSQREMNATATNPKSDAASERPRLKILNP